MAVCVPTPEAAAAVVVPAAVEEVVGAVRGGRGSTFKVRLGAYVLILMGAMGATSSSSAASETSLELPLLVGAVGVHAQLAVQI